VAFAGLVITMTVVTTTSGPVRGRDGVFLGIPYAAPPVGPLRFAAPSPPTPWTEVRDAFAFGPTPPKPPYRPATAAILHETEVPGDDYLNLNVWTPAVSGPGRPVMVWIHGGSFANGNSSLPLYDGSAFARDGVVLVTVNYRLGVHGFAYLPDAPAPANRGLLDQIAALRWVQDNIAAFGGDPANVTVFGESAGAMAVTTLLAMPAAKGLFARAITQSGAAQSAASIADATLVTRELTRQLGADPASASVEETIAAQRAVADTLSTQPDPARFGATVVTAAIPFIPVIDGDTLPVPPLTALAADPIPLLTGTNTDEYRLFLIPGSAAALALTDDAIDTIAAGMRLSPEVLVRYRANRPGQSPGDVLSALLSDAYFRLPALAVATAHPGPTYVYEFAWPSPAGDLRAAHAVEIAFVFDNLHTERLADLIGPTPPQSLADAMHAAWIRFAQTGDPGWPPFDGGKAVMVFTGTGGEVGPIPRADEIAGWTAA
jgi:para-nitrobenzyl esterase